jgi:hypothetical protein
MTPGLISPRAARVLACALALPGCVLVGTGLAPVPGVLGIVAGGALLWLADTADPGLYCLCGDPARVHDPGEPNACTAPGCACSRLVPVP